MPYSPNGSSNGSGRFSKRSTKNSRCPLGAFGIGQVNALFANDPIANAAGERGNASTTIFCFSLLVELYHLVGYMRRAQGSHSRISL